MACAVEKGCSPTRQVFITGGDEGKAIRYRDFVGRKRESKISLGEGGGGSAERRSEGLSLIVMNCNRQESSLMIVDGKAGGLFEQLKDLLGSIDGGRGATHKDESVVGILEDGTGIIGEDRVTNFSGKRMILEQTPKNISNDDEQVGG